MPHLYISAAHKSSGKTMLSIGLCRALRRQGLVVQPFKKGPDYIDPLWLSQASGRPCINLDFNNMARDEIRDVFARVIQGADIGIIEGNVGLYDSVDVTGANSNAELAKHLDAPVLLVIDTQGMTRGIAPLLLGYQTFDPVLRIAGVILNKVAGSRHEAKLRSAVGHYTDIPVVGAIHQLDDLQISERHLGLMPSNETPAASAWIDRIADRIRSDVDVVKLLEIAKDVPMPEERAGKPIAVPEQRDAVRVGIARDEAFAFYYPDDLMAIEAGGATLVEFSPIHDAELPAVDGVFIGGGFPEYRMKELESNVTMRRSICEFVDSGGPLYAECGGLMYLSRSLVWGDRHSDMCGVLNADVAMHARPQGRGYVRLLERDDLPWPGRFGGPDNEVRAHEFHNSAVVEPDPDWCYGFDVLRGTGVDGRHDGILVGNSLICYSHLRDVGGLGWIRRFLAHIRACRCQIQSQTVGCSACDREQRTG